MTDTQTKGTVILVDDDKFLVDMYGAKFSAAGYGTQVYLSAKIALEDLRAGLQPDAILFDITMPEMDGFAFLQQLHDEHLAEKSLKIALTNQSDEQERQKLMNLGADRYIIKASMIPSEVVNTVAEELGKRSAAA